MFYEINGGNIMDLILEEGFNGIDKDNLMMDLTEVLQGFSIDEACTLLSHFLEVASIVEFK